jgi:ATP synthase subunit 6
MITVTYLGIKKHKFKFIYLFIPNGVPKFLILYIIIIELISYLSRILSLSIRLTTNMIAGHVLIYILSLFAYNNYIIFLLPPLFAIFILEIGVSIIQAYVLSVLISTYIKDSLELNH